MLGTPGVEYKTTTSNHTAEVEKTLGIEAARYVIVNSIELFISPMPIGHAVQSLLLNYSLCEYMVPLVLDLR